jgi:hypothetical protein
VREQDRAERGKSRELHARARSAPHVPRGNLVIRDDAGLVLRAVRPITRRRARRPTTPRADSCVDPVRCGRSGIVQDASTQAAPPRDPRARRSHGAGRMTTDPARWDDYVLAALLLLISVPRVVLALLYERPLGVEGTISSLLVLFALTIVFRRRA